MSAPQDKAIDTKDVPEVNVNTAPTEPGSATTNATSNEMSAAAAREAAASLAAATGAPAPAGALLTPLPAGEAVVSPLTGSGAVLTPLTKSGNVLAADYNPETELVSGAWEVPTALAGLRATKAPLGEEEEETVWSHRCKLYRFWRAESAPLTSSAGAASGTAGEKEGEDKDGKDEKDEKDKDGKISMPIGLEATAANMEAISNVKALEASQKAKVQAAGGEWKERALGDGKIMKDKKSGKHRFLMRQGGTGQIGCNHYILEKTSKDDKLDVALCTPVPNAGSDKIYAWTAIDFTDFQDPNTNSPIQKFALKFKTKESKLYTLCVRKHTHTHTRTHTQTRTHTL